MSKELSDCVVERNSNIKPSAKEFCVAEFSFDNMPRLFVSRHALKRFVVGDDGRLPLLKVLDRMHGLLKSSREVYRKNSVAQIIKNGFKPTDYRFSSGWIFVIEGHDVLRTAYHIGKIKDGDMYSFEERRFY